MLNFKFKKAQAIFKSGANVTEYLRKELGINYNTSDIIEIVYDLQSGSYIDWYDENPDIVNPYCEQLASYFSEHLEVGDSLLDVGAGELNTITTICNYLSVSPSQLYAFDVSYSRIDKGNKYWERACRNQDIELETFTADIKKIPLINKSIDIVTSHHALEPNNKDLAELLTELFRVCKKKCILFEPSYEMNSEHGKKRMDKLGYIKDIEGVVRSVGGTIESVSLIEEPADPLNPTACYIITPPQKPCKSLHTGESKYSVPGTNYPLIEKNGFMCSRDLAIVFPILNNVPILRETASLLASSYFD